MINAGVAKKGLFVTYYPGASSPSTDSPGVMIRSLLFWRSKALKDKIDQINQGKVPTVIKRAEVTFHKPGARKLAKSVAKLQVVDKTWKL